MMADRFANNLGNAILNQDDPKMVKDGAPAFLILIDSLVIESPDNLSILKASATLNGAYATAFVDDPERAAHLSDKSFAHGRRAICQDFPNICDHDKGPQEAFLAALQDVDDVELLFVFGSAWAGWIQTHSRDWNAVANLSKVEAIMARIIALDEAYEWGRAHLYMGVIKSQLPPALGGKPEVGRSHFEKAIELSQGKDLVAKVEFARHYARLMFDQALHDELLNDVISTQTSEVGLALSNALAQQQAKALMATSQEYFED